MAHWTREELAVLEAAATLREVAEIALGHLYRLQSYGRPIVQICGPMTTGGLGSLSANMRRFECAIAGAAGAGHLVFDQIPLQAAIIRITDHHNSTEYNVDILEVLYAPIFGSGCINTVFFIPGSETSRGATWERRKVMGLGIEVFECPLPWVMCQGAVPYNQIAA